MFLPRIGIISPEFPPDLGGVENYALGYAQALVDLGYPVTVFTIRHQKGELNLSGIVVKPILKLRRVLDLEVIQDSSIDAWHIMNAAYSWVAESSPKPVVVSVHGNDFLRAYYPTIAPALYRFGPLWRWETYLRRLENNYQISTTRHIRKWLPQANCILTNSLYTEQVLTKNIPACEGKTIPALVGVDPFFLSLPLKTGKNTPQLISITRLSEPRKNIHRVLQALAQLSQFDFRYIIIGEGKERLQLEQLAKELGLDDKVQFTGGVSLESLGEHLRQSDLFILTSSILPTSHEGFGLVYLEAAACGVPSLAARLAGAKEAVIEGESGFFVDSPEVEQIKTALSSFLSGSVSFNRHHCRKVASQFTWKQVVAKALPFYSTREMNYDFFKENS